MEPRERIILPLDVPNADEAVRMVEMLKDHVGAFKIGLELFNAAGPSVFERAKAAGAGRIFYDAKLHDIPNTVAGAMRSIARHGLWMTNLHAPGGSRMIRAAADALTQTAAEAGVPRPILLGVTLLTSISAEELGAELNVRLTPAEHVTALAKLMQSSGGDGVVCSPHEIEPIRAACGKEFLIVTPGVRPAGADTGDQRRTMTPGEAVRRGADYLVIGRPITAARDPAEAAQRIAEEIRGV